MRLTNLTEDERLNIKKILLKNIPNEKLTKLEVSYKPIIRIENDFTLDDLIKLGEVAKQIRKDYFW